MFYILGDLMSIWYLLEVAAVVVIAIGGVAAAAVCENKTIIK